MTLHPEIRWRIAVHESGHAVAMDYYDTLTGVTVDCEIVKNWTEEKFAEFAGGCAMPEPGAWLLLELLSQAVYTIAGPMMEDTVMQNPANWNWRRNWQTTWRGDKAGLQEIADFQGTDVKKVIRDSAKEFRYLSEKHNWVVKAQAVAEVLMQRHTLTGSEVRGIVQGV